MLAVQLLAIRELPWFRNRLEKILFNNLFVIDSRFRLRGVEAGSKMYQKLDANPKIGEKSWRETGRSWSWTTGIGRPRASVAPRPGSGEEGRPAAPLFTVSCFHLWFLWKSVILIKYLSVLMRTCQCDTSFNMIVFIISLQIAVWLLRQLNVIEFQI